MTSFLKSINEELAYLTRLDNCLERDPLPPMRYAVIQREHNDNSYYWDITILVTPNQKSYKSPHDLPIKKN